MANEEMQIPRHLRGQIKADAGQSAPRAKCIACGGCGIDFNDLRAPIGTKCKECLGTGIYDGP